MEYETKDVPVDEVRRLLVAQYPDMPLEWLQEVSEAATAAFNIVFWCELNGVPIGFEDLLAITRRNTSLKGAQLYIATAAATKAANLALEEQGI